MDPTSLIFSVLFGCVGTGYFIYGRKQAKFVPLMVGIVLGIYPYFVSNLVLMFLIGAVLVALPIIFRS